jgi:serine/threonine protein phosphatase PrpC
LPTYPNLVCYYICFSEDIFRFFLEQGNIDGAIRKAFIEFDKEMSLDEEMREDLAGTTAICVIIKDQKLFCVCFQKK